MKYIILVAFLIACSAPEQKPYCGDGVVNGDDACDGEQYAEFIPSCKQFWDQIYNTITTTFVGMPECRKCVPNYNSCEGDDHDKYN